MIKILPLPAGWRTKIAGKWRRVKVRKMMVLCRVAIWG
jgi:hypothetical protein